MKNNFFKTKAIIIASKKEKTHHKVDLYSQRGIFNTYTFNSVVKKNYLTLNLLTIADFELERVNSIITILELNNEFSIENLDFEKLNLVAKWIKLLKLTFDKGELFEDFLESLLNLENHKTSNLFFCSKLLIKKDLILANITCPKCKKIIENEFYYSQIEEFTCLKCSNTNLKIDYFCFMFLKNPLLETIKNLEDSSQILIKNFINYKINYIFHKK